MYIFFTKSFFVKKNFFTSKKYFLPVSDLEPGKCADVLSFFFNPKQQKKGSTSAQPGPYSRGLPMCFLFFAPMCFLFFGKNPAEVLVSVPLCY